MIVYKYRATAEKILAGENQSDAITLALYAAQKDAIKRCIAEAQDLLVRGEGLELLITCLRSDIEINERRMVWHFEDRKNAEIAASFERLEELQKAANEARARTQEAFSELDTRRAERAAASVKPAGTHGAFNQLRLAITDWLILWMVRIAPSDHPDSKAIYEAAMHVLKQGNRQTS